LTGEPVAYITGTREFWSIPLNVRRGVLVPRPDTEILVEEVIRKEPDCPNGCIVDLGTGTGAIAIALAQEIPNRTIYAVERNARALQLAHKNIKQFGIEKIQLIQGDWLDSIAKLSVAIIVSNPPYLASDDIHLASLQHEPRDALVSGVSGFEDYERIIEASLDVLKPAGMLAFEHGQLQAEQLVSLMQSNGFQRLNTYQDLANKDRVSIGYRA